MSVEKTQITAIEFPETETESQKPTFLELGSPECKAASERLRFNRETRLGSLSINGAAQMNLMTSEQFNPPEQTA